MFGFMAFLPRTIWNLLQLLCLGFCLGIATNPTTTCNLLLLALHHIITPIITIIIATTITTISIITSAFTPTFAAATSIWDTDIPHPDQWLWTSPAAAIATVKAAILIWKAFQDSANQSGEYKNRGYAIFDWVKRDLQPAIDNLEEIQHHENPSEKNTMFTATYKHVDAYIKEHATALLSIHVLTTTINDAETALIAATEESLRVPADFSRRL